MLLGQADRCKKASKLELKDLKESKFHPAFMSELEALLLDVYASLRPTASEYEKRKQLILAYNMVARSIFGNTGGFPVVEAFGSFLMDMFTTKSDLDLSINFTNSNAAHFPRDHAIFVLQRLAKVLYKKQRKGDLSGVFPVLQARVPVLKAVDCKTGIECDISVENKDGISRSLFFSIISTIDERFRIMCYLMKAWAKANDINSSKDGTLNSLSIISLVAFHFQTRDPPILPPFSALLRDGTNTTNLRSVVLLFKNFGVGNKESVAELFVALLAKLSSVEKLWEQGLCASIFEGSWISKTWSGSKVGNMSIEDFLDRSQNFARAVGKSEMTKIYACLRGSLEHLSRSKKEKTELFLLRSVLFGSTSFEAQSTHIKSKAAMIMEHKLPTQYVKPIVDINNTDNHAHKQTKTFRESTRLHVDTITTTNHAHDYSGRTLKRKLPSNQLVDPAVNAISPSNHPSMNLMNNLERKLPVIEYGQLPRNKKPTPARAGHAITAATSSAGSHQNPSTIYLPPPVIHPIPPYAPQQPINIAGHPHMPFDPSGYRARSDPRHPIYANMGYGPLHNPLIYGSQHDPTASVHLAFGSHGPHHVPNQVYPIFPGPTMLNTRRNQGSVPSRWFGSNHL